MSAILVIAVAGTGASTGHLSERGAASSEVAGSGARHGESVTNGKSVRRPTATRSEKCHARKGLRFYVRRHNEWRDKMGARRERGLVPLASCPLYLAKVWKRKAHAARKRYVRWHAYHWDWQEWLPDKWARIGACETGYGRRPGDWRWNSGTYQGAFGFYHGTWDQYKPAGAPSEAYLATPRQQYQCALNVYAAHGYGAWGCGGA